jgi:hypothetical protein
MSVYTELYKQDNYLARVQPTVQKPRSEVLRRFQGFMTTLLRRSLGYCLETSKRSSLRPSHLFAKRTDTSLLLSLSEIFNFYFLKVSSGR